MTGSTNFPKVSHLKKRAFLAAFSRSGSLSQAAKRAGVDRRTHYNWLKSDQLYAVAFHEAVHEAGDALEDKLNEMAHDGNATAAIFLLKGLRPEKYRERYETNQVWDGDLNKLSPDQLKFIADQLLQQLTGGDAAKIEAIKRKALEAPPAASNHGFDNAVKT